MMKMLLHITTRAAWDEARAAGTYTTPTLASEGFIHCSEPHQVVRVANERFRGQRGLVLLLIDPARVGPEVRYENTEGGTELFPHIYGPLNADAVARVAPFEPDDDGAFTLPQDL
jgi:uncharacterized protein (DUF952 family)